MSNKETIIDGKAVIIDEGTPEPPVDDQEQNQTGSAPNGKPNPAPDADDEDDEDEEFIGKRIWRKTPKWLKVGLGLTAAAGLGFLLGGVVMNHGSDDSDDEPAEDDGPFIYSDENGALYISDGSSQEPSNLYNEAPTPETVVEE